MRLRSDDRQPCTPAVPAGIRVLDGTGGRAAEGVHFQGRHLECGLLGCRDAHRGAPMAAFVPDASHLQGSFIPAHTVLLSGHSFPLLATGRICQGETLHPGRYLARSRQLLGTHVRARPRTPAVSRGPAQASLGGEHAVRVRSVDLPTVVTRPPIPPRSRSDLSTTVNTQYSLAWAILYLPAAYLVKSSRIRCVYLFLSCHNCHEEPALCNTVDPWNTIPLVVFSSPSSSLFVLVPFPLPTWLRAWPPVGSGVLLIPYELHLGRGRDRLWMMLEVRFDPEMM